MRVFYNEWEPYPAQWLRNLMEQGLISQGVVDERSILDLKPDDLFGYDRVHLFAGIAGWEYALELARWPESRPVWTGSCPCQPFSAAGLRAGGADSRHLWPAFRALIAECRPPTVFGEQVASAAGREWLARVRADLEKLGYAVGGADLCAASCGAPHIRQRLYWVARLADPAEPRRPRAGQLPARPEQRGAARRLADGDREGCGCQRLPVSENRDASRRYDFDRGGAAGGLADSEPQQHGSGESGSRRRAESTDGGATIGLELAAGDGRLEGWSEPVRGSAEPRRGSGGLGESQQLGLEGHSRHGENRRQSGRLDPQPARSPWAASKLIRCADGQSRRIPESGIFPLAAGISNRVGQLRAAGNSIIAQVACEFILAFLECE